MLALTLATLCNLTVLSRVTVEPGNCGDRPCIPGQRMRVSDVLELLAAGVSFEEILIDYPLFEREDILAAGLCRAPN